MSRLVFRRVLIADLIEKKAKEVFFEEGFNVVTSTENHVGKSSLVKSLYYTLGAEVEFDDHWDKLNKLYIVTIIVNGVEYKFARQNRKFLIFKGYELILLSNKVSTDLTRCIKNILNFSVYLPNKKTGINELAPPVFTYLPYYIDQDFGWSTEPYESFINLEQYKKADRKTSLYYHLNVYNEWSVDILSQINNNMENIDLLEESITNSKIALSALQEGSSYIINAETYEEIEKIMQIPKEEIKIVVSQLSESRARLQKLESIIIQYNNQLDIIVKYNTIKGKLANKKEGSTLPKCPNCGYEFDEQIYSLVREQYRVQNEQFVIKQIELLKQETEEKLENEKKLYLKYMNNLKIEENKISNTKNTFDSYVKHKGLADSINSIQSNIDNQLVKQHDFKDKNKALRKLLKKLPNQKEVDENFAAYVRLNLIKLGAWDSKYEKNLKILHPIKGQGTLSSKIILAQYVAFFMTMENFTHSFDVKLPFVIDSPRTKEPSKTSSEDILNLIFQIDSLPQIILATMDFDDFNVDTILPINIVRLYDKRALLKKGVFESNFEEIEEINNLLYEIKRS